MQPRLQPPRTRGCTPARSPWPARPGKGQKKSRVRLQALVGFTITVLDTCVTPISHELYRWGTAQNSLMFGAFAVMGLLSVCST